MEVFFFRFAFYFMRRSTLACGIFVQNFTTCVSDFFKNPLYILNLQPVRNELQVPLSHWIHTIVYIQPDKACLVTDEIVTVVLFVILRHI